jgi:thiamine transport system ATP-binding protein
MTAVDLSALSKRYDGTTALDGIDLSVANGEFFTLVGPSGCGKTTTLRLLAGFEDPTTGTVQIDGESMAGVAPEQRGIGVVFQNYALFPTMSVAENIAYGLHFSPPPGGVSRSERVEDLLDLVDLAGMGERDPDSLSGGQQQRVALARALAPSPRLLLLDEPMSALDASLRERLRVQVREIQQELSITTVYVTHDQEEALSISDRVAVMRAGTVEDIGPPRTVYDRPSSRFAAQFLGDNNIFEGVVSSSPDETEGVTTTVGNRRFDLGPGALTGVNPAEGDRILVCVRPEALSVEATENRFPVEVRSQEFLGAATRVHAEWDGRAVTLRTTKSPPEQFSVGFAPDDAHVLPASKE